MGDDGTVTAVAPGTAAITATMTAAEVTRSGTATVTVRVPPVAAGVQAPSLRFEPREVDIAAGGVVTWRIGEITHDVVFITPNAPETSSPSAMPVSAASSPRPGRSRITA